MGCFVKYFCDINLAVLIVLSALIYIVLLYLVKMFDETDIDIIRNVIKGNKRVYK